MYEIYSAAHMFVIQFLEGFFAFTLLLQHTEGMLNVYTVSRSRPVLCGNNIESYKQQLKSTKSRIYAKHFTKGSLT